MVAVIIIVILVGIALVGVTRLKIQTNEAAAVSTLMKLASSFDTYRTIHNTYPTGESSSVIFATLSHETPPLMDAQLANYRKRRGYQFSVEHRLSVIEYVNLPHAFIIYAGPIEAGVTGSGWFKIDQTGTVYANIEPMYPDATTTLPCCSFPGGEPPEPEDWSSVTGGGSGGGGSSCPYIYVWNGKDYVKDNDILPASNPKERIDFYLLSQTLIPKGSFYTLRIDEELDEITHLDRLGLLQVEHSKDVLVAPSPEGRILTYKTATLVKPKSAIDKAQKNVLKAIYSKGEGDYFGQLGDFIILDFGKIRQYEYGLRLILSTDYTCGNNPSSLHIYVLDNQGKWQKVSIIEPHEKWDIWAVDLNQILPKIGQELKVKIYWTSEHKFDYCLLDTSKQEPIKIKSLALLSTQHSKKDDIFARLFNSDKKTLTRLLHSDNRYVIMKKGDQVLLKFSYEPQTNLDRDFIFVTEGYYIGQHKKIASK